MRIGKLLITLIPVLVVIALVLLPVFWVLKTISPWSSPEEILEKFYQTSAPEDCMADILILNRQKMLPVICEKIKDKNMPQRRYAIYFLGNEKYPKAKEALLQILSDKTEEDYFRSAALEALYMIDKTEGKKCAEKYRGQTGYLEHLSESILKNEPISAPNRTFFDALFSVHE